MSDRIPRRLPLQARYIRADVCDRGCPMVIMLDEFEREIAVAHVVPEVLDEFISQLREAGQVGEARRRPLT